MKVSILCLGLLCLSGMSQANAGSIEVGGEALFLRPWNDDLYFTIRGPNVRSPFLANTPQGKELAVKPGYEAGFRVWGGLGFCQRGTLRLSWEQLRATSTRLELVEEVEALNLWNTRASPEIAVNFDTIDDGFVRSQARFNYDRVDLSAGWGSCRFCPTFVEPIFGASYLRINYANVTHYEDLDDPRTIDVDDRSKSSSGGLYTGLTVVHPLFCGIALEGCLRAGLFVGEVCSRTNQSGVDGSVTRETHVDKEGVCRFIPNMGFNAGLRYTTNLSCVCLSIHAGYRADRYLNALDSIQLLELGSSDNDPGFSETHRSAFQTTGFYLGGSLSY